MAQAIRRNGRLSVEDDAFQQMGSQFSDQPVEDPYQAQEPQAPRMPQSVPSASPIGMGLAQKQGSQVKGSFPGMQAPSQNLGPTLSSTGPTQMTGRASSAPPIPSYQANDTAGQANTLGPSMNPTGPLAGRTETGGFNGPLSGSLTGSSSQAAVGSGLSQPTGLGQYNLEGYDYSRFGNPEGQGNNTWKYKIGSVMSNYDPNDPQQVNAMIADLQSKGVPLQWDGKDKITFGPEVTDENGNQIGTIDIIRGAGAAGAGWAWQPTGGDMQGATGSAMGTGGDPYQTLSGLQAGAMQGDTYSQRVLYYLMQQLGLDQSLMNGSMPQGQ